MGQFLGQLDAESLPFLAVRNQADGGTVIGKTGIYAGSHFDLVALSRRAP